MSDSTAKLTERDLLAHSAWVEALARALARDEHAAQDLVQDTWVAALAHPPQPEAPLRPWFARVVRNAFLSRRRGDHNRRRRESVAARSEAQASSSDVLARLESERLLFEALEALEEPLRSTLVARYLDRESAAAIARRTKVPAATVRWRIQRGLERMRALLVERGRERGQPLAALLAPLFHPGFGTPAALVSTSISGWLAMQATMKVAAALLVALAGVGWWLASTPDREEPRVLAEAPALLPETVVEKPLADPEAASPVRRDVLAPEAPPALAPSGVESPSAEPTPVGPTAVEARLVDARGRALSGRLRADYASGVVEGESDAQGRCRLVFPPHEGARLPSMVAAFATNMATRFEEVSLEAGETLLLGELILEPGARASGVVYLPDGLPAVGASVIAAQPSGYRNESVSLRTGPDDQVYVPSAVCDVNGRFQIEGIPAERQFLWAGLAGMRWTHTPLLDFAPLGSIDDVELRLVPLAREDHIAGIVLDPVGLPIPHARLRYRATKSSMTNSGMIQVDAAGRFDHRLNIDAPHELIASDPEDRWAAATMPQVAPGELEITLQLGERRTMTLEVVDSAGAPVRLFGVEVLDPDGYSTMKRLAEAERAEGRMDVELPASGVRLQVRARGFDLAKLGPYDVATAPHEVRVVLTPLPGIQGRVMAGDTPVVGARLSLHRATWAKYSVNHNGFLARLDPTSQAQAESDADGRFFMTARESGDFALLADAPGFALSEVPIRGYTKGAGAADVQVPMEKGGAIEGRVRVAPGRSPEGTIVAINRGDLHPRTQRVGADGRFSFQSLTPGGWTVRPNAFEIGTDGGTAMSTREDAGAFPADVQVLAGQIAQFDLDLSDDRPCVLRGRLVLDGKPASEWRATLWPDSNAVVNETLPTTVLDPEGRYEFSTEQPGMRRVHFTPPTATGLTLTLRLELARGENHGDRSLSTGRIEGRVGPSAPRMYFDARCDPELSYTAAIHPDAEGRYVLDGLPAAYLRMLAAPASGIGSWTEVRAFDLAAGQVLKLE